MGFWEFLIQKEGDLSWLPLESPDVEVLEGRYRVMARSNRVNTAVEIQISHIATAEEPPKRRTQKRSSQTNTDGLMVVIPFTRLQPGVWELSCASDRTSDVEEPGWQHQHTVKLQVLSHASEATDDWEPDWQSDESELASGQAPQHNGVRLSIPPAPSSLKPLNPLVEDIEPSAPTVEGLMPPSETPVWGTEADPTQQTNLTPAELANTNGESGDSGSDAIAHSSLFQKAKQISQDIVDSVFQDLDAPEREFWFKGVPASESPLEASSVAKANPTTTASSAEASSAPEVNFVVEASATADPLETKGFDEPVEAPTSQVRYPALGLQLDRSTYMVRRGQTLTLTGQIERSPEDLNLSDELPIPALHVRICLHDPQTSQTLANEVRSLSLTTLPSPFECSITIPGDYQTRLLLGELILVAGAMELATQSFTVTADLTELLELIANASESDQVQPPLEFTTSATVADLDLTFLEFLQSPKPMLQFQPAKNQVIPPQLIPTSTHAAKSGATSDGHLKAIALPLTVEEKTAIANIVSTLNGGVQSSVEFYTMSQQSQQLDSCSETNLSAVPVPTETTSPANSFESSTLSEPRAMFEPLTLSEVMVDDSSPYEGWSPQGWQPPQEAHPHNSTQSTAPEDTAFRSLNLQNRFLSRLNALASDTELSSSLRHNPLETLSVNEAPLGLDTDLAAMEVVVEDDVPVYGARLSVVEPPATLVLSDDEPVPAPELSIPSGELVSGQSIFVTVKIPDVRSRVYVKLWVLDRQTRSLLEGPRWFMAFVPDGLGNLETRTQITVPYGCLEVMFEAIAVEMTSKRESHKVGVDRTIVPPNLPSLSLTDLDIE